MTAAEHVVTAAHDGSFSPRLIAGHVNEHEWLVDALLREDGPTGAWFYVSDRVVQDDGPFPRRWLRVGYHNGYGAAFFHDDSTAPDEDWAWIALNPEPLADAPSIFYDLPTPVIFPPAAVMPLGRLREVVLEWCATGERPACVKWLAVNDQMWDLDQGGNVIHSPSGTRRRTIHTVIRNQVVRMSGWGTDRSAPDEIDGDIDKSGLLDHRTGRTAFGAVVRRPSDSDD